MKTRLFALILLVIALALIPAKMNAQQTRYKLMDLGTFGGQASYFQNGFDGILNPHGAAVGWADTPTPDPNPAFPFNFDGFVSHAFQWRDGKLTDLGTLAPGWSSAAFWTSNTGITVGISQNGMIDPLFGFGEFRAALWEKDKIIDLGTLGGGYESLANAVNNHGQVVGLATNTIADPFSYFGVTQATAFLWEQGVIQDLGTLGGPDSNAIAINDAGQIAGQSYTDSTPNPVLDSCGNFAANVPTQDPFVWKNGKMTDLGTLGGTCGSVTGQNARGQIIGQSDLAGDLAFHPFVWDEIGGLKDLGTLGGNTGVVNWISDTGDIAGKADLPGPTPQNHNAVLWHDNAIVDLGTLPGDSCANAYYVNSHSQVVGTSESRELCLIPTGEHAFLWEGGGPMIDLNTLIPAGASLQLTFAVAINDRGEIAGFGVPPACLPQNVEVCGHAYVLVPCNPSEEDCSAAVLGASLEPAAVSTRRAPNSLVTGVSGQYPLSPHASAAAWLERMAHRLSYR